MNKWFAITLGSLLGISHIGMIGMIARKQNLPVINVPVGQYTSYQIQASKDGYNINYKANDPKIMRVERDVKRKAGFLGLGNNTYQGFEEYTVEGSRHTRTGQRNPDGTANAQSVACIEAIGGGKQSGRLVGASVGAAVSPTLASVPFVGWVLAGAATMMGMDAGSDIGGTMVADLNKECQEELQ
tara:strand:- start:375 stop:929 length:555 start_codon:yes stop_codon:yes gene_type:complete